MAGGVFLGAGSGRRRLVVGTYVMLTACGLAAMGWGLHRGTDVATVSNVAGIVSSLLGMLGVLAVWARRPAVDAAVIGAAADNLALVVLAQHRGRREQLLGAEYRAIDVTFRYVPEPGRNAEHADERGSFTAVGAYYTQLQPRRLVITGEPGAGKTLLAVELVVQLLEERPSGGAVPLVFSLPAWDTDKPLTDWLAAEVALSYGLPLTLARALVEHDRIVPVLDGLDEMDAAGRLPERAEAALGQLNRYHRDLVLTCRIGQYAALRGRRRRLWDCAVVDLDVVSAAQVHDYLSGRSPDRERWRAVLEDIRQRGDGALAVTLTTPWLLALASSVALAEESPAILERFVGVAAEPTGARELQQTLVRQCIPALTALHPSTTGRPAAAPGPAVPGSGPAVSGGLAGRGRRAGRRYDSAAVESWCAHLARFLRDTGGRSLAGRVMSGTDMVPHYLWPISGLRAPRLVTAAVTVALWVPLLVTGSLLVARQGHFPHPGTAGVLLVCTVPVLSVWGALSHWLVPRRIFFDRLLTPGGALRFGLGLFLGCVLGLNAALAFAPGFGLLFCAGFCGVFALGLATAVRWDIHLPAALVGAGLSAIGLCAAAGAVSTQLGVSGALVSGLGTGCVALYVAVKAGVAGARRYGGGLPDVAAEAFSPHAALRYDIAAGLIAGTVTATVAFFVGWQAAWVAAPPPLAAVLALTAFLAAGPGFVSETSRRYLAMLLTTRGRLPWRLGRFLAWAHAAGILRTASTAYQFRHHQLQQWLAR
ncbi:NACHT domain-containing protein [Streptomyces sp. WMMC500]|uniref:NACHT domain-containing protein n=1 Tax=Streptomyces sp. WMMC500 TaxID=3015154 RepID=UPI00248CB507|nr:NACHT domain-containing protein [Streptomyces sp. WMMC500]WBB60298.1 NACHT domain-containing protein [Streptomyces sp. WMMC500]